MEDLSTKECIELLGNNYIGRIAYILKGSPEIVPITYFFDPENNSIISYSGKGGKIEAMRQNSSVSFQVDEISNVVHWKSVLIHGEYEELEGLTAKHLLHKFSEGVKKLVHEKEKTNPKFIREFSSKIKKNGIPIVYRINIKEVFGRQRES
ncbi:MAG: pyridoxamine 5'-phosphate oxidase family protein [Maribacter sp.]|nr:pyridoxamine 5'-phosphate oxidase family protein [Maribacter sp.]